MASFAKRPSNLDTILAIRSKKDLTLKPNKYLKDTTKLRYYQIIGCLHFLLLSRFILGDSAGLGKSLMTIAGYVFSLMKNPNLKLLVITQKSARYQWKEEFEKFTDNISAHVVENRWGKVVDKDIYGPPKELRKKGYKVEVLEGLDARIAQYQTINTDALIVNWYAVQNEAKILCQNRLPEYMVVFDEIQEIKNDKTVAYLGAEYLIKHSQKAAGLSATIIKNRLEEAYNIFEAIVPGIFGGKEKFLSHYTNRKKIPIRRGGKTRFLKKIVSYKNLHDFKDAILPYFLIRRTSEVASELPDLIAKRILLDMDDDQHGLYKEALAGDVYRRVIKKRYFEFKELLEAKDQHSDKELEKLEKLETQYEESTMEDCMWKNKAASLTYCQMIANGPQWLDEDEKGSSVKEEEFERIFEQELCTEKVIVFTRFASGIPRLEKILKKLGLKSEKVTGKMSQKQRDHARHSFQNDPDVTAILITYAGSAAINLQSANVLLFYDTPWSYGDLYQTIGRAQRIGSIHEHIYVIHFVAKGTIDEHVLNVLREKKKLINDVMGDIAEGSLEFDKDKELFVEEESDIDALFDAVFVNKEEEK